MNDLFLVAQSGRMEGGALLGFLCLAGFGLFCYLLPGFIAAFRNHPNTIPIFLLTILLGWSFVGWAVAFVWAFTAIERPRYYRQEED